MSDDRQPGARRFHLDRAIALILGAGMALVSAKAFAGVLFF